VSVKGVLFAMGALAVAIVAAGLLWLAPDAYAWLFGWLMR
jgi:flagellar biosynthesis/type III secretory pathway M-ring protein FliF/YscJ